jgi:hypothetical protein
MAYLQISPIPIVQGGTDVKSFTAYSVIAGGTTSTGPLQNVGTGTAGQLLTSAGSAALPTWQNVTASSITITGNTGGGLTGNSFTFTGGTTGLSFGGSGTTETLTFAGITANAGVVNLGTDSAANAVNIGTVSSTGRVITIGNVTGTTGINQNVGTGNFTLNGVGASSYNIGAATTTGSIIIGGTAQSGPIHIGTSSGGGTIIIGNGTGASAIDIGTGTGSTSTSIGNQSAAGASVHMFSGSIGSIAMETAGGPIIMTSTGGLIQIGTDLTACVIDIGNVAVAKTISIGSTVATSSLTLSAPSAGMFAIGIAGVAVANKNYVSINTSTGELGSDAGPTSSISITGNTGGALVGNAFTFTGGTTGLSFGGSGTTETLTFAGITANGGTVSLATDATTSTINIGTGAGAKTSTVGSTNSTSSLTLNSGSGGIIATGVAGIAVANKNYVSINTSTGALGSDAGPGPGALVLIQTKTAISGVASVQFTSGITTTYNDYLLVIRSLTIPSSVLPLDKTVIVQISTNGGSSYITSGYAAGSTTGLEVIQVEAGIGGPTMDEILASSSNTLNNFTSGFGYVSNYGLVTGYDLTTSTYAPGSGEGLYLTPSTVVNAFQITTNNGTSLLSAASISLYGYLS